MTWTVPHSDVLLKVLGAPHQTELITSLFRLAEALLERGATVQVWTCGDATGLTTASLGDTKPCDVTNRSREFPSTAALARNLITAYPQRLNWYICRFCSEERGGGEQIREVRTRPAARFWEHVRAADQVLVMGVC